MNGDELVSMIHASLAAGSAACGHCDADIELVQDGNLVSNAETTAAAGTSSGDLLLDSG
jgi:hypothetical protein